MDIEGEIEVLRAETFATQSLAIGLIAVLLRNGQKDDAVRVFEFAEALLTATAMQDRVATAKKPATETLGVLYRLRDGVFPR